MAVEFFVSGSGASNFVDLSGELDVSLSLSGTITDQDLGIIYDYCQRQLNLLAQQFKQNDPTTKGINEAVLTDFQKWLCVWFDEIQESELSAADLWLERSVQTASGVQLDNIGDLVGEPRNGQTDTAYRASIQAKILENQSSGTMQDVSDFIDRVIQPDSKQVVESFPAQITVELNQPIGNTDPLTISKIAKVVMAGVGVNLVSVPVNYFGFDADPNASGFDDGEFSSTIFSNA